jgi:hypothetical protein
MIYNTKEELDMVKSQGDTVINKAADVTLSMNADEHMRELARIRLDSWLNEQTAKHIQKMQTIKETQMLFVKNMISEHLPLDLISRISNMSISDIQKLQQGLPI